RVAAVVEPEVVHAAAADQMAYAGETEGPDRAGGDVAGVVAGDDPLVGAVRAGQRVGRVRAADQGVDVTEAADDGGGRAGRVAAQRHTDPVAAAQGCVTERVIVVGATAAIDGAGEAGGAGGEVEDVAAGAADQVLEVAESDVAHLTTVG